MIEGMLRYDLAAGAGPMQTLSSASRTHMAPRSASECTATVEMPISLQARWMRSAISPRLAIRTLVNMIRLRLASRTSGSPNSTGWASPTRMSWTTTPSRGAWIGFMVFIASTISRVWPFLTVSPTADEGRGLGRGLQIDGADHRRLHLFARLGDDGGGVGRHGDGGRSGCGGRGGRSLGASARRHTA